METLELFKNYTDESIEHLPWESLCTFKTCDCDNLFVLKAMPMVSLHNPLLLSAKSYRVVDYFPDGVFFFLSVELRLRPVYLKPFTALGAVACGVIIHSKKAEPLIQPSPTYRFLGYQGRLHLKGEGSFSCGQNI